MTVAELIARAVAAHRDGEHAKASSYFLAVLVKEKYPSESTAIDMMRTEWTTAEAMPAKDAIGPWSVPVVDVVDDTTRVDG